MNEEDIFFEIHNTIVAIELPLLLLSRMGASTFYCCGIVVDIAES
jgi:hypothetical protein